MTKSTDVLIVGAGPTGLYCGLRLAEAGIAVTILEGLEELDKAPKAVTHMPTMYGEYKRSGIYDDMFRTAGKHTSGAVAFRRSSDRSVVEAIPPIPGRPGPLVLAQFQFCGVLERKYRAIQEQNPSAKLLMGHRVEKIELPENGDVTVNVRTTSGEEKTFTSTYIIGADGSNSRVRQAINLQYEGETLPYKLIAADVSFPLSSAPSAFGFGGANFMCDDEYYGIVAEMFEDEEQSTWRVSCGFPADFTDEQIKEAIPEKFEKMLPGPKPLEYKIKGYQPYKVHQMCVPEFKKGRAILIGDAAHCKCSPSRFRSRHHLEILGANAKPVANPYSGQLLSCGIFDAASLGDVLASILQKSAPTTLLDQWATARREKYTKVMDPLSRACFAAVRNSKVETVGQRHPFLKAMLAAKEGKGKPPPTLATDVSAFEGYVPVTAMETKDSDPKIQLVWGSED